MKKVIPAVLFLASVGYAQAPGLQPTDQQSVELQLAKLDRDKAQLLWIQKAQALPEFQSYQNASKIYKSTADKIKIENKWPASVEFNDASGVYYDTKPPEKK